MMPAIRQHYLAKRFKDLVEQKGRIHKFEIMNQLGISISTYEKLKPWLEYTYFDFMKYDKDTKEWIWLIDKIKEKSSSNPLH